MSRDLTSALSQWLAGHNPAQIGQIAIAPHAGGYTLCHADDFHRNGEGLQLFTTPEDARTLDALDDRDAYRPLKSAPNLRHGWSLSVSSPAELRLVLDLFYPAAAGLYHNWQAGTLAPVSLRETLGRQSGMYAVTRQVTDEQADETIGSFCTSAGGCLKTILWRIAPELPIRSLPAEKFDPCPSAAETPPPAIPLLCPEACNLLVAKIREVVKAAKSAE